MNQHLLPLVPGLAEDSKRLRFCGVFVKTNRRKSMIGDIQKQVTAHGAKANHTKII